MVGGRTFSAFQVFDDHITGVVLTVALTIASLKS